MNSVWNCIPLAIACAAPLAGQGFSVRPAPAAERGHVALLQAARDASSDQQALIIASHPDDRHVMPAAYLRFARGWRVAVLLMTRGEGGQNSQGPEIGDELGWRRTMESEACAAMLDYKTWYLNRQDAGYCRSAAEALDLWGRQDTIEALAGVIRRVRPDVVLTTHDPDENHGHDLALLEVLPAALALAEDSSFVVDGLPPVSVAKAFRGPGAAELGDVRDLLPMDDEDLARGETYRKLAYAAVKQHKSQEPIRPMAQLFDSVVRLYPLRESDQEHAAGWLLDAGLPSLFDGRTTDQARELKRRLSSLVDLVGSPGGLERESTELYEQLLAMPVEGGSDATLRKRRRLAALQRVVMRSAGLRVTAEVLDEAVAVTGKPFPLRLRVKNSGRPIFGDLRVSALAGGELALTDGAATRMAQLPLAQPFVVDARYLAPPAATRREHWLKDLFGASTFDAPMRLRCLMAVVDPDSGQRRFDLEFDTVVPVDLRPAVELEVEPPALLLSQGKSVETVAVTVSRFDEAPVSSVLEVLGPPGFVVEGSPSPVEMAVGKYQDFQFRVHVPEGLSAGIYNLHVLLGRHRAVIPVHKVDVRVPDELSVGLVRGVDDNAESVLRAFVGDRLRLLDERSLARSSLADLSTIVIDIRALRERPGSQTWKAARAAFPRLLSYVERGGRLVVLYHKDTEFNLDSSGFVGAPFPLHVGRNRVTREDAPVELLEPDHVLMNFPNKIQPEDWDGWVQERGLYFPEAFASEYTPIIGMGDPGHEASQGALLYARHGDGEYIYCALALFRQLDGLHEGACKIFANLVAR